EAPRPPLGGAWALCGRLSRVILTVRAGRLRVLARVRRGGRGGGGGLGGLLRRQQRGGSLRVHGAAGGRLPHAPRLLGRAVGVAEANGGQQVVRGGGGEPEVLAGEPDEERRLQPEGVLQQPLQ